MTVLAVEGYEPEGLGPIEPEMLQHIPYRPGERVAFAEDHPEHGREADENGGTVRGAKYGVIQAVGLADGGVRLDLLVFHPDDGVTDETSTIYRARMGELQ